ncbi:RluA family pseudouridine synthase [Campylobacter jejuni]|uniref:RNA pseudouridylate synthase n=1 Tax=Campylobacter jejuni TaxID=197 RepID=A0A5Y9JJW3_CAMJU|nr:RluA family pseudouridine synthase [Campylobacter coli]EAI4883011.1 RluA family pseudouridine synthase [Campylobacter jejuni]EAJ8127132.1 RluA family pseudouridine synthase [Campylobacter jejuni]EAK1162142.1 RluA family pseudouridine synthase [Campylobacter jejuni]EAK8683122.1 RluA family pseudouridine synthase [Campylobacter jejuni]ECK7651638.1 RluA family pseudouridine synthase [Campylobacter jejuni]
MAYTKIKLSNNEKKAFQVLMENLKISINEAQKLIDKKRLFCDGILVEEKNKILKGIVELIVYENNPKGVEIVFENEDFAVLEKESGILSHPNGRHCKYSLSDEIWHLWGKEACVAHRLDKETSGLILVAKNKKAQIDLKALFEKKLVQKEYLALANGKIEENFIIDKAINLAKNYDDVKTRMQICKEGKQAITEFEILEYFPKINATLLLCKPLTGRQHQIRVHLFYKNHKILGDPLYGLEKKDIEKILDDKMDIEERIKLSGAKRLCLHSYRLKFNYNGENFDIFSKKGMEKILAAF